MLRIRASSLSRILSGTLVTVVVGFSLAFSYLLLQLSTEISAASTFFSSASALLYITVEAAFLALVIFGAYAVIRRKK